MATFLHLAFVFDLKYPKVKSGFSCILVLINFARTLKPWQISFRGELQGMDLMMELVQEQALGRRLLCSSTPSTCRFWVKSGNSELSGRVLQVHRKCISCRFDFFFVTSLSVWGVIGPGISWLLTQGVFWIFPWRFVNYFSDIVNYFTPLFVKLAEPVSAAEFSLAVSHCD